MGVADIDHLRFREADLETTFLGGVEEDRFVGGEEADFVIDVVGDGGNSGGEGTTLTLEESEVPDEREPLLSSLRI